MKLFMAAVRFKHKHHARTGVEVSVHDKSRAAATAKLQERYTGGPVEQLIELDSKATKHFVVADLVE